MLEPIFSVTEFNTLVGVHLGQLGEVVVEGELVELKVSQGKWVYGTLKDENASVNLWGMVFQLRNLNSLQPGMLVRITGNPTLYQKTGRFSLNMLEIVPSGEGALQAAFEKLKRQLEAEGLFDPGRKRPLPSFPRTVGLLTAPGSEAYNDFLKITDARTGGVSLKFYPVQVQGKDAVTSVIRGLRYFNDVGNVELVIITRGGGSLEDLAAFNDESLVREIFGSRLPVVCAIGHEGDVSLAELAADLRASTPSNAAELTFRDRVEILREVDHYTDMLEHRLLTLIATVEASIRHSLTHMERQLDHSFAAVDACVSNFQHQFSLFDSRISFLEKNLLLTQARLHQNVLAWIKLLTERVGHSENKLRTLDPRQLLKRGYSLLQDGSGRIVRSISQVAVGMPLASVVADGIIASEVTGTRKESDETS